MNCPKRCLFLLSFVITVSACTEQPPSSPVIGSWKMRSGTYTNLETGEQIETTEQQRFCIKIMSPNHFAVVEMFKSNPDSLFFAAVGTYRIDGDSYAETYEASNVGYQVGSSREFEYSITDGQWVIQTSQEDMELHEVWVRTEENNGG